MDDRPGAGAASSSRGAAVVSGGISDLGDYDRGASQASLGGANCGNSECGSVFSSRSPTTPVPVHTRDVSPAVAPRRSRLSVAVPRPSQITANQEGQVQIGPLVMNKTGAQGAADNTGVAMFADSDALRHDIHANIAKKDYNVADFYHSDGVFQAIARSRHFVNLTLLVIAVNAIWIGLDTDCNDASADGHLSGCIAQPGDRYFWTAGEQFFCIFFTFEQVSRFMAFKKKINCLRDNWFKFDSLLVTFMVLETWVIPLASGGSSDSLSNLSMLKMFRLLRLTRMVRLMRSVPELVTLLKGMAIASRSVSYTLLLLVIFMYVFAIIFKSQLAMTPNPELRRHFHNIPRSMWTLMLAGCMLDDTTYVANLIVSENFLMSTIFVMFILVAALMILNMLIGVLCAVVTAVAAAEKEKVLVTYVKMRLMSVLERLDQDGNGTISQAEFDQLIHITEAVEALEELGVDVANLASLSDHLFEKEEDGDNQQKSDSSSKLLDGDEVESNTEVSMTFADFLEMVIRLRADNSPSVADVVELRKLLFRGQRMVARRFARIEKSQMDLNKGVQAIFASLETAEFSQNELEASLLRQHPALSLSNQLGFGDKANGVAAASGMQMQDLGIRQAHHPVPDKVSSCRDLNL